MVWNLSCPAVSQICNFIFFPWSSTVLILKSIPIVEINVVLKVSSENLKKNIRKIQNLESRHLQMPPRNVLKSTEIEDVRAKDDSWWDLTVTSIFTSLPEQDTSFADSWITNKQKFKQKIFTVILIDSQNEFFTTDFPGRTNFLASSGR